MCGYGDLPPQTVITLGLKRDVLDPIFGSCTWAARLTNRYGIENATIDGYDDVFVCNIRQSWPDFWKHFRYYADQAAARSTHYFASSKTSTRRANESSSIALPVRRRIDPSVLQNPRVFLKQKHGVQAGSHRWVDVALGTVADHPAGVRGQLVARDDRAVCRRILFRHDLDRVEKRRQAGAGQLVGLF
jgi:hypothetical protein